MLHSRKILTIQFLCTFQRRLFDDTREAEKVLHFFETRNIGQIVQLTIVPLFHSSILRVKVSKIEISTREKEVSKFALLS